MLVRHRGMRSQSIRNIWESTDKLRQSEPFGVVVSQSSSPDDGLASGSTYTQPRGHAVRTILLVILILLLLGALPTWPYSTGWGYYPSGGLGLVLVIVIILVLAKRI